jgi:hypothetical protein
MVYIKDTNELLTILKKYKFDYTKINLMKNSYFLQLFHDIKNIYNKLQKSTINYNNIQNNVELENNNFMTTEITNHCKKLKYGYEFQNNNNIIHYFTNKEIKKNIPSKIKKIFQIIEILKHLFDRNKFQQKITIYDLNIKKYLPTKNETIGPNHCNSGLTSVQLDLNGDIILYRNEELLKVCIHELLHSNLIDSALIFSNISKKFTHNFCFTYTILLNEAYTECIAVIIHIMYIAILENKNIQYVNQLFNNEIKYSIYNVSKILEFYQIKSINEIIKINNTCTTYFKQETNVFSYYFLKLILFLKIDDLNNLLIKYTSYYKINNNKFIDQLYELLKNNLNLIDKYRLKKNSINNQYNNSLRLTLYEIK